MVIGLINEKYNDLNCEIRMGFQFFKILWRANLIFCFNGVDRYMIRICTDSNYRSYFEVICMDYNGYIMDPIPTAHSLNGILTILDNHPSIRYDYYKYATDWLKKHKWLFEQKDNIIFFGM